MQDIEQKYKEAVDWLFSQVPAFERDGSSGYKPGLERVRMLAEAFGNPQEKFSTIHVAGTNGKGSVSSLLAATLLVHGSYTALYTSPHLLSFTERIRIGCECISKEEVVDFIGRYRAMQLSIEPSFFELTTVMAFDWMARHGVETAVIETGLGGRLDATNIITPRLSVITNISLDHTDLLGDTPELIAREKAGIIKPGVPVVIGRAEPGVREVFEEAAGRVGAPIFFAEDHPAFSSFELHDDCNFYCGTRWGDIVGGLTGDVQAENANTAFTALALLDEEFDHERIFAAFDNVQHLTGLFGRWTEVLDEPPVIFDTGHNPGAWRSLAPRLERMLAEYDVHLVLGFVADKDVDTIVDMLPRMGDYYICAPATKRALDASELLAKVRARGLRAEAYPDVVAAFDAAKRACTPDGKVFMGGSNYLIGEFLQKSGYADKHFKW